MRIVIAAGGTGGHLFPASVVKDELEKRGHEVFLITDSRGRHFAGGFARISTITGGQWSGEGLWRRFKTLVRLGIGFLQSFYYMVRIRPHAVLGMGGYISVPVVLWGAILRKRTVIFNADAILGNANILLAKFVDKVALAFDNTLLAPSEKSITTGLPIRKEILNAARLPYPQVKYKVIITILGGSQGAQIFSDIVPAALAKLKGIKVFHQVIAEDLPRVAGFYKKHKIDAKVKSFFENPAKILRESHIFIGRAGANSVYEIGALGIPAIFVPIKHKDKQQYLNAEKIAARGGAVIIEQDRLSAQTLTSELARMIKTPNLLAQMAAHARIIDIGNDAASNIADLVEK
ncbi:MAG: UDP-N-acetylglucosamine--N-acetylmuramyl-(pentapeptide) pyrophosphoryl-undecaprenol N-acetylglucosamine transferase [Rickettsiales bacterium]|jgi:UDP-N-acetylglucosamine--N-acetylmuramyl-(pentapeptide) pyrophosphoryl-undecaprenol N-acetylglucosamine transferase|nr:UDP-N-acetylglucosamine--N-acetylmuramyl-(pentapeptide) pyrophosphoryl-undecaprenol N-acetylglucosamine transferase [Rickettsiales bacterium]